MFQPLAPIPKTIPVNTEREKIMSFFALLTDLQLLLLFEKNLSNVGVAH